MAYASIYIHVNCPAEDENDAFDMAERWEAARALFTRQCPLGARVVEIVGLRSTGRKKCEWRVRYERDMDPVYLHIQGDELLENIMRAHPNNTTIIEKSKSLYPPFIELVYSCICRCRVSRTASMSIKIKRCGSVGNLKVEDNLANLKLEENLQE